MIDQINRALDELNDRSDNERKATDRNKSAEEYLELAEYARKLTSNGEISKQVKSESTCLRKHDSRSR